MCVDQSCTCVANRTFEGFRNRGANPRGLHGVLLLLLLMVVELWVVDLVGESAPRLRSGHLIFSLTLFVGAAFLKRILI
ncbi:hypothetical protein BC832DRAFT_545579 [Gaertneriomyces semiglobifer]|nr:hypothetical protein BC832DRAFT_545579 [Gaertneriomyces semiglobifer]